MTAALWWTPLVVAALNAASGAGRGGLFTGGLFRSLGDDSGQWEPSYVEHDATISAARAAARLKLLFLSEDDCGLKEAYQALAECVDGAKFSRIPTRAWSAYSPARTHHESLVAFVFVPSQDLATILRKWVSLVFGSRRDAEFENDAVNLIKCASGKWSRRRRIPVTRQPEYHIYLTEIFENLHVDEKAETIIHECAHLVLKIEDRAYRFEASFSKLSSWEHDHNADSYSVRAFPRGSLGIIAQQEEIERAGMYSIRG